MSAEVYVSFGLSLDKIRFLPLKTLVVKCDGYCCIAVKRKETDVLDLM